MRKPSENANQPPSFVVSTKSMFQLVSTGDIIGRVQVIYLLFFCRYIYCELQCATAIAEYDALQLSFCAVLAWLAKKGIHISAIKIPSYM